MVSEVYFKMAEEAGNQPQEHQEMARALAMMADAVERANDKVAVPSPPVFDNSKASYTIDDLFILFEPYAKAVYGPKSRSWVLALQAFLEGDAKEALIAMGPIHTAYDQVKQQLQEVYRGGTTRGLGADMSAYAVYDHFKVTR